MRKPTTFHLFVAIAAIELLGLGVGAIGQLLGIELLMRVGGVLFLAGIATVYISRLHAKAFAEIATHSHSYVSDSKPDDGPPG